MTLAAIPVQTLVLLFLAITAAWVVVSVVVMRRQRCGTPHHAGASGSAGTPASAPVEATAPPSSPPRGSVAAAS